MEMAMGRVLTRVTIEDLGDLSEAQRGSRAPDDVRRTVVQDALNYDLLERGGS